MPEPFKNLFNATVIAEMGEHLHRRYPAFAKQEFIRSASRNLADLELKQRAAQITAALELHLPQDFLHAREILLAALHPEENADLKMLKMDDQGVRGWAVMPMADFIARRGLPFFDQSLTALAEMTKRFSAEFAVRTFINADIKAALRHIRQWAGSPNEHVRRLASEGARPRLPWAEQIPAFIANPAPMLPILQRLRDDPSEYVRRSVANHLNDIAKDHPQLLETLVPEWLIGAPPQRRRLLRHACRTLIKKGNSAVLQAFGYTPAKIVRRNLQLEVFALSTHQPRMGDKMTLRLRLISTHKKPQQLVVDYVVHWLRANGQWSPKVFKWKNIELPPGGVLELTKNHSFQKVTTRTYYPGAHKVAVQINGCLVATLDFDLFES